MNNLVIDIETIGSKVTAPILSIGAVQVDFKTGILGPEFYQVVKLEETATRLFEISTLRWWMNPDRHEEFASLLDDPDVRPLKEVLEDLLSFYQEVATPVQKVWCVGPSFDIAILEHAFKQYRLRIPWPFWLTRDIRTLEEMAAPHITRNDFPFRGTRHNALNDARHEAIYASAMYRFVRESIAQNAASAKKYLAVPVQLDTSMLDSLLD